MGKDWDKFGKGENPAGGTTGAGTPYGRNRIAPAFYHYGPEEMIALQSFTFDWATEALRVAKPGAVMLCFGGTRTFHRIACGIEDAGWEIRDTMMWIYGSGFPKSHNISKAIDKRAGAEREIVGKYQPPDMKSEWNLTNAKDKREIEIFSSSRNNLDITAPATDQAKLWDGWGTALKPAFEPIIVAMKPRDGTFVENALKWGVAGLNIDGSRVPTNEDIIIHGYKGDSFSQSYKEKGTKPELDEYRKNTEGRWPANIVHDGSEEVVERFPKQKSGAMKKPYKYTNSGHSLGAPAGETRQIHESSEGSAARFFYTAKASKKERNQGGIKCDHPTVKPLSLMIYLARLTKTPTAGIVLDPFMGSGTTGMACKQIKRDFIGIELDKHYFEIAEKRIASVIQPELL